VFKNCSKLGGLKVTTVSTIKGKKRGSLPGYKSSVFAQGALSVQYVLCTRGQEKLYRQSGRHLRSLKEKGAIYIYVHSRRLNRRRSGRFISASA
jgi:hypothetical protein